ncbi:hypothetical protein BpHYR1_053509 [Brachionus plicatilis]|uniref:Uncharacterized protein n=1 Tax=Brachionus plicatilis TaxID=10195 RepID=A0A3M7S6N1_BRAPC|nr:hypothetical protein BpHYR1_053509 [Brachionus plicatilis]
MEFDQHLLKITLLLLFESFLYLMCFPYPMHDQGTQFTRERINSGQFWLIMDLFFSPITYKTGWTTELFQK